MGDRKYVSISGPTHAKRKEYCKLNGLSVARVVDMLTKQHLGRKVTPVEDLLGGRASPEWTGRKPIGEEICQTTKAS